MRRHLLGSMLLAAATACGSVTRTSMSPRTGTGGGNPRPGNASVAVSIQDYSGSIRIPQLFRLGGYSRQRIVIIAPA